MLKAYNHINIIILIRTLSCLYILEAFIKFLILIFLSYFNQVFITHGNSDTYLVPQVSTKVKLYFLSYGVYTMILFYVQYKKWK